MLALLSLADDGKTKEVGGNGIKKCCVFRPRFGIPERERERKVTNSFHEMLPCPNHTKRSSRVRPPTPYITERSGVLS